MGQLLYVKEWSYNCYKIMVIANSNMGYTMIYPKQDRRTSIHQKFGFGFDYILPTSMVFFWGLPFPTWRNSPCGPAMALLKFLLALLRVRHHWKVHRSEAQLLGSDQQRFPGGSHITLRSTHRYCYAMAQSKVR